MKKLSLKKYDHLPKLGFWKIQEGVVCSRTWDESGDYKYLGFYGEGDFVSYDVGLQEANMPLEIVALSPSSIYKFEPSPQDFINRINSSEHLLVLVKITPIENRVLMFLKFLEKRFGKPTNLPHDVIAATVNTTRVTITRSLGILEEKGKISRNKRSVSVV